MRVADKVEEIVNPILEKNGLELVDVFFGKEGSEKILRVYIDKSGGVSLDDCAEVSRTLNKILDEKDFIEEAYVFEVSSPGVNRVLKKEKDFIRFSGEKVDISLYEAIGNKKKFTAVLVGFNEGNVLIELDEESLEIPLEKISKANLHFDFN